MISDCSTDHTYFGRAEILYITNVITCLLEICATSLGAKTGKKNKLGAQIDIINTLSMAMVKIFSQLLLYIPYYGMDDRYLSLSAS